MRVVGERN